MSQSFRFEHLFKILAGLCIGISLYWLWPFLSPWLRPSESAGDLAFAVLMGALLGIPGFLGCYFGFQGLRKTDPATARRLVGSYCLFLVVVLGGHVSAGMESFAHLSEAAAISISYLVATVAATIVYWFTSRYCLRRLGHQCAPVRRSLSRLPIALVALQVWEMTQRVLLEELPERGANALMRDGPPIIASIALAIVVYKLGVWLFVEQGSTAEQEAAAGPRPAPSAEA
ncbi:MAG: hypothetical protein GY851_34090 [bacterium]|nr:hypothetical protein [bacterium]